MEEAIRISRELDLPGLPARGLLDLGVLCKRKRRLEEARAYLDEARQIAEREQLTGLGEKIGQALGITWSPNPGPLPKKG